MACEPRGTRRSLFPLPTQRAIPAFKSTSPARSPATSEARQPVAYKVSRAARSRRPSRVSRLGASSNRSTAAGPRTVGRRSHTAGAISNLATFSGSRPSPTMKRKKVERLARCRHTLDGARPERESARHIRLRTAHPDRPAGQEPQTFASGRTASSPTCMPPKCERRLHIRPSSSGGKARSESLADQIAPEILA